MRVSLRDTSTIPLYHCKHTFFLTPLSVAGTVYLSPNVTFTLQLDLIMTFSDSGVVFAVHLESIIIASCEDILVFLFI